MSDWLELELAEELRPVAAPDELWERVRHAAIAPSASAVVVLPPSPSASWARLPVAAILTLAVAAATLWLVARGQGTALDLRQLAIQELRGNRKLTIESASTAEINDWMRRETGFDPALPERSRVQLTGARVVEKSGVRVGEVCFRVGDEKAVLLVARAVQPMELAHGRAGWQTHGVSYALASSSTEHPEVACQLCHSVL